MRDPGEEPKRKHCQAGLEFPHTERSGSQQLVTPDDATSQGQIKRAASKGGPGAHITVTLSSQQWDRYLEAAFEFTYMQTCKTDSSLGPASVQRVTKNLVSLPPFLPVSFALGQSVLHSLCSHPGSTGLIDKHR
jgi:hypothetical protein